MLEPTSRDEKRGRAIADPVFKEGYVFENRLLYFFTLLLNPTRPTKREPKSQSLASFVFLDLF